MASIPPDVIADVMVQAMKNATAPLNAAIADCQQKLAIMQAGLDMVQAGVLPVADLAKEYAVLRERIAVVEVKAMQPGPPGQDGAPGKNGADGKPGLTYCGVFVEGKSYDVGELVTWGGSMWHCNEATESKPGEGSKAWTLTVKRGRDGKDYGK